MSSTKKNLTELYFKAMGEKKVLKRIIQGSSEPIGQDIVEITQIDNLIDNLREILGTVVLTVP
ncbi:MAG: hypothetical protein FWH29_04320 [Methanobrevibacter sp.]|nr:hypothetical protein [Methanobrevibacter sp.]